MYLASSKFDDVNQRPLPDVEDIVDVIGHKHWRAADRVNRMRDAMNGIFRREHKVSLDRLRATFAWKARGLDADGLAHRLPSSSPSLGTTVQAYRPARLVSAAGTVSLE